MTLTLRAFNSEIDTLVVTGLKVTAATARRLVLETTTAAAVCKTLRDGDCRWVLAVDETETEFTAYVATIDAAHELFTH